MEPEPAKRDAILANKGNPMAVAMAYCYSYDIWFEVTKALGLLTLGLTLQGLIFLAIWKMIVRFQLEGLISPKIKKICLWILSLIFAGVVISFNVCVVVMYFGFCSFILSLHRYLYSFSENILRWDELFRIAACGYCLWFLLPFGQLRRWSLHFLLVPKIQS